jgi:MoaA/NifB/PqqE/SkfB family radical SAM enzyme
MSKKITCYYALGGLNFKNGFATSCPQQSDQLQILDGQLPSEFWNNKGFRDHRKELMSGDWCRGCHLCKDAEEADSIKSMRHDYPVDETYYDEETGAVDFKGLHHVELRFSNSCNMACLHCSQVYSSGWVSKLKRYEPTLEDHTHHLDQLTGTMHRESKDDDLSIDLPMSEVERIVNDLNNNFPNIEKIDFAGGEVLHQKQFFPCLERLANHPNAENIELSFHTNFNAKFDPVQLSKLLEPFGKTGIKMSLDAGKNLYPYFRGGDWEVLKENVRKFNEINDFTKLEVVLTTSIYQMMDLPDIFESFLELDVQDIDSSIVFTPGYLNPALMMFHFKDEVMRDIKAARQIVKNAKATREANHTDYENRRGYLKSSQHWKDIESSLRSIDRIEQYVLSHKPEYKHWEAFLVYRKKTDILWKQDFNSCITNYQIDENNLVYRSLGDNNMANNYYKEVPYNSKFNISEVLASIDNECNNKIEELHKLDDVNEIRKETIKTQKQRIIKSKAALDQKGLQAHLVDGVYIPFNPNWKQIAINLSGGADSACLTFLLADIIQKNNYKCTIDVITHSRVYNARPWAGPISIKVYQALKDLYPNIICNRITNYIPPELEHGSIGNIIESRSVDQICVDSFNTYIQHENGYDAIFNATTKNPSMDTPTEDRMRNRDLAILDTVITDVAMNKETFWRCLPLKIVEKDWVVKQYIDHNKLELFKTTRSCEGDGNGVAILNGLDHKWFAYNKDKIIPECGLCFWCAEREWAMKENNIEL